MSSQYAACPVHRSSFATVCEVRGYCGPFIGHERYDSFPHPEWHGLAECVECGSTVSRRQHEARRLNLRLLFLRR